MKYKLIATDYDWTLTNGKVVSQHTKDVIRRYVEQGGYFTIATGRMTAGILNVMGDITVNAPIVTYQGAIVYDIPTATKLYAAEIDSETAARLTRDLKEKGLKTNTYINDNIVVDCYHDFLEGYCAANKCGYEKVDSLSDHILAHSCRCSKILSMFSDPGVAGKYREYYAKSFPELNITLSTPTYLEFNALNASKGIAVDFIAKSLGIDRSEVMCFGDSTNDLSMIRYAGLGVAMGDAMPDVIAEADYVAEPCGEDGVAKTIEKFCF